jgi:hypothetical protein
MGAKNAFARAGEQIGNRATRARESRPRRLRTYLSNRAKPPDHAIADFATAQRIAALHAMSARKGALKKAAAGKATAVEDGGASSLDRGYYDAILARLGGVVEVKPTPTAGKGLFATKAVRKGEVRTQRRPPPRLPLPHAPLPHTRRRSCLASRRWCRTSSWRMRC